MFITKKRFRQLEERVYNLSDDVEELEDCFNIKPTYKEAGSLGGSGVFIDTKEYILREECMPDHDHEDEISEYDSGYFNGYNDCVDDMPCKNEDPRRNDGYSDGYKKAIEEIANKKKK